MTSTIPNTRALTSASYHIDPLNAARLASERYNIPCTQFCVDPNLLRFDQYGRQAHPYSLTAVGQGGQCSALSAQNHLQAWIARENIEKPFIGIGPFSGAYDTMGIGRNFQNTLRGGTGCSAVEWERSPGPITAETGCCDSVEHHETNYCTGRGLSSAYVGYYTRS